MNKLTHKQALFVQNYLIQPNATLAAKNAGYSDKTAYSIGQENLKKPEIAAAIQQAMSERSQRLEIRADKVLQRLAEMAFSPAHDAVTFQALRLAGQHIGLFNPSEPNNTNKPLDPKIKERLLALREKYSKEKQ